jgi:hypothetical protein
MTSAMVLLAYGLALLIGEEARDEAYGGKISSETPDEKGGPLPLL